MLTNELEGVNKDVYKTDWQWQEGEYTVTRTNMWTAPGCHNGCSVLYYTKDGKVEKIEGDPLSPYNQGRLCMRCLDVVETFYHPDRLKYPLKRVGERGENKWERITWDEAYDDIVEHVKRHLGRVRPRVHRFHAGHRPQHLLADPVPSYAGFGSPNFVLGFLSGDACYLPRTTIGHCFMGDFFVADCSQHLEKRFADPEYVFPEYMLIVRQQRPHLQRRRLLRPLDRRRHEGRRHEAASCSTRPARGSRPRPRCWLPVRPGTDAAVVIAMLGVIIEEDLYDHDFVENWCYGFDELAERCKEYPVELAAEIAGVEAEDIRKAARAVRLRQPLHHPVGPQGRPDRLRHPAGSGVCSPWAPSAATSTCPAA